MEITDHVSYFVWVGSCLVFKCLGVYFAFWLSSLSLSFSFSFSLFDSLSLSFSFFLFLSLSFSFFLFLSLSLSLSLHCHPVPRAGCAYFPCSLQHLGAGTFHFASQHFGWGDTTSSCKSLHVGTCVLALCMTCNIV